MTLIPNGVRKRWDERITEKKLATKKREKKKRRKREGTKGYFY